MEIDSTPRPYSEQLQAIIKEAEEFVAPILKPTGTSISEGNSSSAVIERLSKLKDVDGKSHDVVVIEYVLALLSKADGLLIKQSLSSERNPTEYQLQPAQQKIIALLLDIVVFEGILYNLSPGVGLPVEKRPLYPAPARKTKIQIVKETDIEILRTCVRGLQALVQSGNAGLKQIVLRRCATELISGNAELAFNLNEHKEEEGFYRLLNSIPTGTLLPLLTTFLHPATPPWFQKRLTGYMSRLPMDKKDGLKSVIEFIVDVKPGGNIQNKDLVHLRRLLTSLPESVTEPDKYFSVVVPQLLSFLEVPATESSIGNVAAYVLGGLAFRWKEAGEKYLLQPIFSKLIPTTATADSVDNMDTGDPMTIRCIVQEEDLHQALTKISMLVSFPNKNLVSMILKPVILSLWALAAFSQSTKKESWKNTAVGLLQTYLKVCGTALEWDCLVENLLYDGERNWKFDHGSEGGVEIRWRPFDSSTVIPLEQVDEQIALFTEFIKSQDGDIKGDLLLRVLQRWLEGRRTSSDEERDPIALLKDAKILQLMFEDGAEHVVKKIPQVLQLVEQLLNHYVGILDAMDSRTAALAQPSLRNLGRISELSEPADTIGQDEIDEEALTVALNLLSTVVAGLDQLGSDEEKQRLQRLGKLLQKISHHRSSSKELSSLSLNLSMVLAAEWQVSDGGESGSSGDRKPLESTDTDTYAKALEYLRDPLVPVRAHGIHLLKNLIVARSSVLDIPETVNLLLSVLTENDSFVYLNCISCLLALSERHPKTVLERLLSKYVDHERERSNDERLRIGEVLLRFVQRQAKAITGEIAKDMGSALVYIASRGGSAVKLGRQEKQQAEKAASTSKDTEEEEGASDTEQVEEEGIRIRASALSILGALMETNINSVPTSTISDSLDIALHVLKLERSEETVVTRRAAVLLILYIMKSASDNLGPKYRFVFEKIDELQTVLYYVEATDRDLLIKRNTADVLESLNALVEKLMIE